MDNKEGKIILVVEDEAAIRKLLVEVLQKENFSLLEAPDGNEGIKLALEKHPDLILLDLLMPDMHGMEALEKIRNDTWGENVPVIILTNLSADSEELVESMVNQHPIGYLIKSEWKMEDVVKKVKEVLKS